MSNLNNKKILLIICGGIAAYKSLELIRLLKKDGVSIKTILTKSGAEFVTPLSITSLSQSKVYQDLFSIENEAEMDHISLSRWADLILIAPATANTISKLANGNSDDLRTNNPFVIVEKINYDTKGNYIRPKLTGDAAIAQSWIVGTWQAATMRSEQTIKFNRDGSYEFFENGVLDESESGLYYFEQDNGEVVLRVKEVDVDEVGKVKIQFKNKDEFTIEFSNGRLDTVYRFR